LFGISLIALISIADFIHVQYEDGITKRIQRHLVRIKFTSSSTKHPAPVSNISEVQHIESLTTVSLLVEDGSSRAEHPAPVSNISEVEPKPKRRKMQRKPWSSQERAVVQADFPNTFSLEIYRENGQLKIA
jgi:hypothetical protein